MALDRLATLLDEHDLAITRGELLAARAPAHALADITRRLRAAGDLDGVDLLARFSPIELELLTRAELANPGGIQ